MWKLWAAWASVTVLALIPVLFVERIARKTSGAPGWMLFGWFMIFFVYGIPIMALLSLLVWLVQRFI